MKMKNLKLLLFLSALIGFSSCGRNKTLPNANSVFSSAYIKQEVFNEDSSLCTVVESEISEKYDTLEVLRRDFERQKSGKGYRITQLQVNTNEDRMIVSYHKNGAVKTYGRHTGIDGHKEGNFPVYLEDGRLYAIETYNYSDSMVSIAYYGISGMLDSVLYYKSNCAECDMKLIYKKAL